MDKETAEALEGSIRKWEAIVAGTGKDEGINNCPLCQKFYLDMRCDGCPVSIRTGKPVCEGSPYDHWGWSGAINDLPSAEDRFDARKVAQAELDFLISLREPETLNAETR